jgi:hypothetical protein
MGERRVAKDLLYFANDARRMLALKLVWRMLVGGGCRQVRTIELSR